MNKQLGFIAAALVAGLAAGMGLGYVCFSQAPEAETEDEASPVASASGRTPYRSSADEALIASLRKQIEKLEGRPSRRRNAEETPVAVADAQPREGDRQRGERQRNPGEWLENLKASDPARYAQMTNRYAQWRNDRLNRQQSKLDFLASVDTSRMSPSARKTHERLQDLIVRREEIEDEMHADPNMSRENRGQIFSRIREVDEEIGRLNGEERQALLGETARTLGLGDADAQALADTVQEIIRVTDNNPFARGPGGGRGGRGGPRSNRIR